MLDTSKIKAISLDLDDTLWPIWPVIERAEKALLNWLGEHAPMTAAMFASPAALREIREYMANVMLKNKPEMRHDLGAIRLESIRLALYRAKEDPLLAERPPTAQVKIVQPVFQVIDAVLVTSASVLQPRAAPAAPQDFTAANAKATRGRRQQVVPAFEVVE